MDNTSHKTIDVFPIESTTRVGTTVVTIAVVPSGALSQPLFSSLWERHQRGAAIDKTRARSEHAKGRKPDRVNKWKGMVSLVLPNQDTDSGERLAGLLLRIKLQCESTPALDGVCQGAQSLSCEETFSGVHTEPNSVSNANRSLVPTDPSLSLSCSKSHDDWQSPVRRQLPSSSVAAGL